jgi:hypothetical protein
MAANRVARVQNILKHPVPWFPTAEEKRRRAVFVAREQRSAGSIKLDYAIQYKTGR